ncbi:MAG: hypothetical protein H7836_04495 [Magnetococcus sp. YQC-3]
MSLSILGTWSDKFGSCGIRYFLDEPVSHIAFMFDQKLVIHSSVTGVCVLWANEFLRHQNVYTQKDFNLTTEQEEYVYQELIKVEGSPYDYEAFTYFAYCAFKKKYFGTPLPKKNKFGKPNKFLCTELAGLLPDFLFQPKSNPFKGQDLELISPYQVIKEII